MKKPSLPPSPTFFQVGLFAFLVCLALGCTEPDNSYLQQPVIRINGQSLSAQEFSDRLAKRLRNYDAIAVKDEKVLNSNKQHVLREYLVRQLTEQWARANGLQVTEAELEVEVNKIRGSYPDDLAFRRALTTENIAIKDWKDDLRHTLLQRKVSNEIQRKIKMPSDAELNEYYQAHKEDFKVPDRAQLRQIVLDREENAELVLKELRKGAKFEDMARKFSISPEASQGGDMGWVDKGTLDIFDTAFKLNPGDKSSVLKSPYGYHILTLIKKSPARQLSFSEAKDKIRALLMNQREQESYQKWLEEQIRKAKVERDEGMISSIKIETRGDN